MVAQRGAKHPLKVTTIQYHEDLGTFIRQAHIDYINHCAEVAAKLDDPKHGHIYQRQLNEATFGGYLSSWFANRWYIHECKPSEKNKKTGKSKQPKNLCAKKEKWGKDANGEYKKTVLMECPLINIARDLGYNMEE